MKRLTLVYCYYNLRDALIQRLDHYASLPDDLRDRLRFVIVDDGSRIHPAERVLDEMNPQTLAKLCLRVVRIGPDIKWNQPEANNVAVAITHTDWFLRLDMDHWVGAADLRRILSKKWHRGTYYGLARSDGKRSLHSPPNIYLMHRNDYWRMGGYNEYFSGAYGDDKDFCKRAKQFLHRRLARSVLTRVEGAQSTRGLSRNLSTTAAKLRNPRRPFWRFRHKPSYRLVWPLVRRGARPTLVVTAKTQPQINRPKERRHQAAVRASVRIKAKQKTAIAKRKVTLTKAKRRAVRTKAKRHVVRKAVKAKVKRGPVKTKVVRKQKTREMKVARLKKLISK